MWWGLLASLVLLSALDIVVKSSGAAQRRPLRPEDPERVGEPTVKVGQDTATIF
jgi:hypothetical protein